MDKTQVRKVQQGKTNRHKIRFSITRETSSFHTAVQEVRCVVLARLGRSTNAIAESLNLSPGKVAYRVKKGGAIGARKAFREGRTWESRELVRVASGHVIQDISQKITPKFL